MMGEKILLIGGGGHCKSILDTLSFENKFEEIGIVEKDGYIKEKVLGISIIGCDEDLINLFQKGYKYAFVSIGGIGKSLIRRKISEKLEDIGFIVPIIIDKTAIVSKDVIIEKGTFVGKNTVINAGANIGKGSIINTGSVIEHDCLLGEFVHIAPGSILCGGVKIGDDTHIGAKSVVKQQINIGTNTIVGIGSVVTKDIKNNKIAYGVPCKEMREHECFYNC